MQDDLDSLLESENAFALVTAAHLLTRRIRSNPADRYTAKMRLIRILFARGWARQRIPDLFAVIDWLMRLPVDLERKLAEDIRRIEEEHKMQYVTSIERLAREDGREDGLSEGLSEGQQRQARRTLQIQLARRFGAGGLMETAFPPENIDDYLVRRGFIFLGYIEEVLKWTKKVKK